MRKEDISNFMRWLFKTILIVIGFGIIVMPFIPAFKEYVFDAPEKEFGAKEVFICLLGVLIFTGGLFSKNIVDATKSRVAKILNK